MESYFQAVPSVRSTLEGLQVQGEFASFRVRVTWTHGATGEQRSQASLAVYQVVDGLIVRCWYYPASS